MDTVTAVVHFGHTSDSDKSYLLIHINVYLYLISGDLYTNTIYSFNRLSVIKVGVCVTDAMQLCSKDFILIITY